MKKTACWDSDLDLLLITPPQRHDVTSADRLALKNSLLEAEPVFEVCVRAR